MRALITEDFHSILVDTLSSHKIQCDEIKDIDTQGVMEIIQNYDILVVNSKIKVDKPLIDKAIKLKIIGRVGSGMEIIDVDYCLEKGIQVFSAPEGNANAVAEHALAMLLSSMNQLFLAQEDMLNGKWQRELRRGEELSGKTVGIIGYGHTGSRFASLLNGFNVKCFVHDKDEKEAKSENVFFVKRDELLMNSDVISLHLPLNESTFHYANSSFFEQTKKGVYFINTSRGPICDYNSLVKNIKSNQVKVAMLDVYENEPFFMGENEKEWIHSGRMITTPHIAGWTHESKFKLAKIISEKIISATKREDFHFK